jgi:hypothetical protein
LLVAEDTGLRLGLIWRAPKQTLVADGLWPTCDLVTAGLAFDMRPLPNDR